MVHEQPIELVTGESFWLRVSRYGLFATAAVLLAFAPSDPVWRWAGVASLALVYVLVSINLRRMSHIRSLRLLSEGMVTLGIADHSEIHASLDRNFWTSAWLTVIPVVRDGQRAPIRLLVCRSLNHPQDYRQLLKRLRLGSGSPSEDGILKGS